MINFEDFDDEDEDDDEPDYFINKSKVNNPTLSLLPEVKKSSNFFTNRSSERGSLPSRSFFSNKLGENKLI